MSHQSSPAPSISPSNGGYMTTHSHFFSSRFGGVIVNASPTALQCPFSAFQVECALICPSLNAFQSSARCVWYVARLILVRESCAIFLLASNNLLGVTMQASPFA